MEGSWGDGGALGDGGTWGKRLHKMKDAQRDGRLLGWGVSGVKGAPRE